MGKNWIQEEATRVPNSFLLYLQFDGGLPAKREIFSNNLE